MKRFLYSALVVLIATACDKASRDSNTRSEQANISTSDQQTPTQLNPLSYVQWVNSEQNELFKSKTIDEVKYILRFKPHEYMACMEIKKDTISAAEIKSKEKEFEGMLYYDFKIHIPNGSAEFLKYGVSSTPEYQQRVSYCSFSMQHDISLVQGSDTIPCSMFLFERAYDVTPEGTFLVGFDEHSVDLNKEITFVFNDRLFRKGMIKFTYAPKSLSRIPKLKTV